MYERYRSRKFLITLLVILVATASAMTNHLTSELAQVLTAGITAFNLAQGGIDMMRERKNG